MTTIHMVYDQLGAEPYAAQNLLSCNDRLASHDDTAPWRRFNHTALSWWLREAGHHLTDHQLPDKPLRYIYATSTYNGPRFWAGWPGNEHGFDSLFRHIPAPVMADLRAGHALFMLDQMMEGYSDDRLWPWLHAEMDVHGIPAGKLLFWSGNWHEQARYLRWCAQASVSPRIIIGSLRHLEMVSLRAFSGRRAATWRQHVLRRSESDHTLLFNCLNRAKRYHRNVMFMELQSADLLRHGLISMDKLTWTAQLTNAGRWDHDQIESAQACLPMRIDLPDFTINPAFGISSDIYHRTLISLITETMADDEPHSLFITEKVFKCIHQSHPFMVLGQRGHLRQLREWGYETFHRFWDESYDDHADMHDRASAIAGQLRHMATRDDMAARIDEMNDIVQHNLDHFLSRTCKTTELQALADVLLSHMRGN